MDTRGSNALKPEGRFTLKDWKAWPEGERWELIHGVAWGMSPAPRLRHQRLLGSFFSQLDAALKGKTCEPFIAPVDVFIEKGDAEQGEDFYEETDTVVQPDLMIVCDPAKCRDEGIFGAPDWILEILSPATSYRDQTEKRNLYEKCGVREYWICNPDTLDLIIYRQELSGFSIPIGARLDVPVALGILPDIKLVGDSSDTRR